MGMWYDSVQAGSQEYLQEWPFSMSNQEANY